MADRILLGGRELGHRALGWSAVVVRDEDRVVAEAPRATWRVDQAALARRLEDPRFAARLDQRERTHVFGAAIRRAPHLVQELREVLLVGRVLAREARRMDPGPAAQNRHR